MPLHDTGYKHWEGKHRGIWYRRWAISYNGLRGCLQVKALKSLVVMCWSAALALIAVLFFVGQMLVTDSLIVQWIGNLGARQQKIANGIMVFLERQPEITVRAAENILFFYASQYLLPLSLVAIAIALPHLITRDLGSKAIIIYSSKAISRFDYILGKAGTIFGLLCLTWLGPLVAGWFFGNLIAPKWHFFWHSRAAILHTLSYTLICMVILTVMALGVSAISSKERITPAIWMGLWLGGNALIPVGRETGQPWVSHLSYVFNFDQIGTKVFNVMHDIDASKNLIPGLTEGLQGIKSTTWSALQTPMLSGAITMLILFTVIAAIGVNKKVKPE